MLPGEDDDMLGVVMALVVVVVLVETGAVLDVLKNEERVTVL